jgi:hypothetical protein
MERKQRSRITCESGANTKDPYPPDAVSLTHTLRLESAPTPKSGIAHTE